MMVFVPSIVKSPTTCVSTVSAVLGEEATIVTDMTGALLGVFNCSVYSVSGLPPLLDGAFQVNVMVEGVEADIVNCKGALGAVTTSVSKADDTWLASPVPAKLVARTNTKRVVEAKSRPKRYVVVEEVIEGVDGHVDPSLLT